MSKLNQEFFWMPDELAAWVRSVCAELGLWLVIWHVGRYADVVNPEALQSSLFSGNADSVQLFLGDQRLFPEPQWRVAGDQRELDLRRTYAVQLVPSLLAKDGHVLLQGRLAIMRESDYGDVSRYASLGALFRRLTSDLKHRSDSSYVIVQPLAGGGRKRWKDIRVGAAVPGSAKVLKQFSGGEVEFRVERA